MEDNGDPAAALKSATLTWPETVHGVAVVAERIVLPADQEQQLPTDPAAARSAAAASGQGHELRVAAAATRSGVQYCLLRLRRYDDDQALLAGENLMAGLTDLLRASLT